MTRKVHRLNNLQTAEFVDAGPFSTDPKLRGKALEGIRYQAKVHEQLQFLPGNLHSEQWIRFRDESGYHYCRPDDIVETYNRVVVFESKLSLRQLKKGLAQLKLYKPILQHIFGKPVICVLAFKHWIIGSDGCLPMIDHPEQTLSYPVANMRETHGWNFM